MNRPATATYADGSTVSYTFDLGGRLTKVVDSVGGTVTRAYDGLDRLTSEITAQGTVTYTYDAASRLATLQAPNQALITYGYDNDNRLTSITQGTASVAFGYDNASRRTSGTTPSGSWAYTYDAASQLTQIAYTGYAGGSLGTLTYTYGLDGSVTSRGGTLFTSVLPAAVTSAAYNAGNRLTSRVTSAGTQTPVFDANGSLTSDGINSFTWDPRNRMTAIGSQASFVYDAFGRRASVTKSGGAPIGYLYSGDDVIQEQQSGAVLAQMLTGLGIDERYVRAGELILNDLLGSTVALSNGSTIQTSYAYDPYGVTTTAGAATTNTYQFTGRENDGTTAGLMFYRARYYNPAWGRFVSEDPIGVAGGVNLYAYVRESPLGFRDPSGQQWLPVDPEREEERDEEFEREIEQRGLWSKMYEEGERLQRLQDLADKMCPAFENLGGGPPLRYKPTPKGAPQWIFPNGMKLRFDLQPGQYLGNQGPHINIQDGGFPDPHIPVKP